MVAHRGAVPLGYHGDEAESARGRSRRSTACAGRSPATSPPSRPTAPSRLLGRGASSINRGGEKVFPEEVEAVLKSHRDVFDAVVLGVADERWGERVVAVVQPRGRARRSTTSTDHCRAELADFKVPRQVVLVDAIARLSTGKADIAWAAGRS